MHIAYVGLLRRGEDQRRNGLIGRPLGRRAWMPAGHCASMFIWNTNLLEHGGSETFQLIRAAGSIIVIIVALE